MQVLPETHRTKIACFYDVRTLYGAGVDRSRQNKNMKRIPETKPEISLYDLSHYERSCNQ